jgi:hypothetical protein
MHLHCEVCELFENKNKRLIVTQSFVLKLPYLKTSAARVLETSKMFGSVHSNEEIVQTLQLNFNSLNVIERK